MAALRWAAAVLVAAALLAAAVPPADAAPPRMTAALSGDPVRVELAGDLRTMLAPAALGRVGALEARLARIPGVRAVYGPASLVGDAVAATRRLIAQQVAAGAERDDVLVRLGALADPSPDDRTFVLAVVFGAGVTPKARLRGLFPDGRHAVIAVRPDDGLSPAARAIVAQRVRDAAGEARLPGAAVHVRDPAAVPPGAGARGVVLVTLLAAALAALVLTGRRGRPRMTRAVLRGGRGAAVALLLASTAGWLLAALLAAVAARGGTADGHAAELLAFHAERGTQAWAAAARVASLLVLAAALPAVARLARARARGIPPAARALLVGAPLVAAATTVVGYLALRGVAADFAAGPHTAPRADALVADAPGLRLVRVAELLTRASLGAAVAATAWALLQGGIVSRAAGWWGIAAGAGTGLLAIGDALLVGWLVSVAVALVRPPADAGDDVCDRPSGVRRFVRAAQDPPAAAHDHRGATPVPDGPRIAP